MQKLPEASDRKRGDACAKIGNRPDKRKKSCSLSGAISGVTTLRSFLLIGGGRRIGLPFHW